MAFGWPGSGAGGSVVQRASTCNADVGKSGERSKARGFAKDQASTHEGARSPLYGS